MWFLKGNPNSSIKYDSKIKNLLVCRGKMKKQIIIILIFYCFSEINCVDKLECNDLFSIHLNSSNYQLEPDKSIIYNNLTFPVDTYVVVNKSGVKVCPRKPINDIEYYISSTFLSLSVLLLIFTLLSYADSPGIKNPHGISLALLYFYLIIGFLSMAIIQIFELTLPKYLCLLFGFIKYYFLLGSFFWLNILCFDIWWTFRNINKVTNKFNSSGIKKFVLYCMYGIGMPIQCLIITIITQFVPGTIPIDYQPGVAVSSCWLNGTWPQLIYYHSTVLTLLLLNLYFFVHTIVGIKEKLYMLEKEDLKTHSEGKQRFKLYLKLYLILGINVILELFSWFLRGPSWIWYISDIYNTLQGLVICILCILTTKPLREIFWLKLATPFAYLYSIFWCN